MNKIGPKTPRKNKRLNLQMRLKLSSLINMKFGVEPVFKVRRILQVGSIHRPLRYACTLCIGENEITLYKLYLTKSSAESQTAYWAYNKLRTRMLLPYTIDGTIVDTIVDSTIPVKKPEEDWIHASSPESVYTYLPNNILAVMFKEILDSVAFRIEKVLPFYYTHLQSEGGITGYSSIVAFDGKEYKSFGIMLNESQAEQSAAEICLRTIGDLPDVDDESMLIIQPYEGGTTKLIEDPNYEYPPYIFTSSISTDALKMYLNSLHLHNPQYYVKKIESQFDPEELTADGEPKQMMDCICCFEGKIFKARYPQVVPIVKELAAVEALKYFSISNPQNLLEIRKNVRVSRYDFVDACLHSPFHQSPRKREVWVCERYCKLDKYNDLRLERLFSSGIVKPYFPENTSYVKNLVLEELTNTPALRNVSLSEMNDLAVAEIDANNPNVFLIGNSQFSIKMLCDRGKLLSRERNIAVKLLPGHNIQQLKCEYRVTLPSLELYVKGLECEDLSYPNPPLPVVTSCGTVVLLHDWEASPNDIYVVLRRMGSILVRDILDTLILPKLEKYTTPLQCVEGIRTWKYRHVKLLSGITMAGVLLFMPRHNIESTKWSTYYEKPELPDRLEALKVLCKKELKRRLDNGYECEPDADFWDLPESELLSRFMNTGVHVEDSNNCALRALVEAGGMMRVKLNDIDTCPTVDVPVESNAKQHRGDINRYYIWTGCHKYAMDDETPTDTWSRNPDSITSYFNDLDTDMLQKEEGWQLLDDNVHCNSAELHQKLLLNNHPTGNAEERQRYIGNVRYSDKPDGKTVSQEKDDVAAYPELFGEEIDEMKRVKREAGIAAKNEAIRKKREAGRMKKHMRKDIHQRFDEPMSVDKPMPADEPVTDEYGTIGEYSAAFNKQAGNSECDQGGDKPIEDGEDSARWERRRREMMEIIGKTEDEKLPRVAQMAFREHCCWMKLDEAVDVCTMLKKLSVTPQFQNQIKKLIVEANSFMESKGMSEKVQTSVFMDGRV